MKRLLFRSMLKAVSLKWLGAAVAALVLFEAGLRLSGLAVSGTGMAGSGKETILCVGDSFVWGVGGTPFPEQLAQLLEERAPGRYTVVNAGRSGANSAQVLRALPSELAKYRPAMVIALFGMNNSWNSADMGRSFHCADYLKTCVFFSALFGANMPPESGAPQGGCEPDWLQGFDYIRGGAGKRTSVAAAAALPAPGGKNARPQVLADYYVSLGNVYSAMGSLEQALAAYLNADSACPGNRLSLLALARQYADIGDFEKAGEKVAELLRVFPEDGQAQFAAGYYNVRRAMPVPLNPLAGANVLEEGYLPRTQAYALAAGYFKKALELEPERAQYAEYALESLLESGQLREAQRSYGVWLERFPESDRLAELAVKLEVSLGHGAKAEAMLDKRKDSDGLLSAAYAEALLVAGQDGKAREKARKFLEKRGWAVGPALSMASAFKAHKLYAFAAELLEKSVAVSAPADGKRLAALADLYLRGCRYDKALSAADAALKLIPGNATAAYVKGSAYAFAGEHALASAWLEKARVLAPRDARVLLQLARLSYKKGVFCWKEKAGICAYMQLPGANGAEGEFGPAFGFYAKALELEPFSVDIAQELEGMLQESGKGGLMLKLGKSNVLLKHNPVYKAVRDGRYVWSGLEILPDENFNRRLAADVGRAARLAREAGAGLLVSSYPENDFAAARSAAVKNGAAYVDLTGVFKRAFKKRGEYTAYDSFHCNSAGYRIMAEAYAGEILKMDKR